MDEPTTQRELTLLELVDRLIEGGVVIHGDITLSVADIDLVYVGLRALVTTVTGLEKAGAELPPSVRTSAL
jgi:gas vesicle structural protein